MPANAKQYREYVYRHGAHPQQPIPKSNGSAGFPIVLGSLLPFLIAEYFIELKYAQIPSGIAFPVGHLLFWAFYYTYARPGYLEKQLSDNNKWDLHGIPTILLGSLIWFVKLIFVELIDRTLVRLFISQPKPVPRRPAPAQPSHSRPVSKPTGPAPLPRDLQSALGVLGIESTCRDWSRIQKRYRELAKQFHPDLNSEITQVGNRFMLFDAAYRKLEAARSHYFIQ